MSDDADIRRTLSQADRLIASMRRNGTRKRPRAEATAGDAETANALRRTGLRTNAEEVAFSRQWFLVGWSPTLERTHELAIRVASSRAISPDNIRIEGDEQAGWALYVPVEES